MKQTILIADKPTANGNIYPRHVLEAAIKKLNGQMVLGQYGFDDKQKVEIDRATHVAKDLRLEGDALVADIEIVPGPFGDDLKKILEFSEFKPQGIATITFKDDNTRVVDDYEITGINAVLRSAQGSVRNYGKKDNEVRD